MFRVLCETWDSTDLTLLGFGVRGPSSKNREGHAVQSCRRRPIRMRASAPGTPVWDRHSCPSPLTLRLKLPFPVKRRTPSSAAFDFVFEARTRDSKKSHRRPNLGARHRTKSTDSSPGGAAYNSPGRKSWVSQENGTESRRDDTTSLAPKPSCGRSCHDSETGWNRLAVSE
jgi:hypothetical protein